MIVLYFFLSFTHFFINHNMNHYNQSPFFFFISVSTDVMECIYQLPHTVVYFGFECKQFWGSLVKREAFFSVTARYSFSWLA